MASSMLTAETTAAAALETNVDEALNTTQRSCANDPNFAVICSFLQKFANDLGLDVPSFKQLQDWLTRTDEVAPQLRDMQIKLLRKTRKTVHEKSWENALSKFCFAYSAQDAWEVERFGYKNAGIKVKLRILRELLESQFERNSKFRAKIATQSAESLRSQPVGRDRLGHSYWVTQDRDCNFRIYQEHLDEDIWQVVATNRDEFVNLITRLKGNEVVPPSSDIGVVDEDTSSSYSCPEVNEKPPPPEERDDSQEDEHKVPKLSIKLLSGKSPKETEAKCFGKGEEELAAEEDAKIKKACSKDDISCDEEFEEAEEEYETESNEDVESDEGKPRNSVKTVKPLLIQQNKIKHNSSATAVTSKKRSFEDASGNHQVQREESQQSSCGKKARPSLLDSKKTSKPNKYEEGEENYEETTDDEEADEEIEEEDIDSAAAEEDETEEKLIEDFDDDDDDADEVGEEITDPVFRIKGEGAGEECESANLWLSMEHYLRDEDCSTVGGSIEEAVFFVRGEGTGHECLVGNVQNFEKATDQSDKTTPTDTDKSPVKSDTNADVQKSIDSEVEVSTKHESDENTSGKDDITMTKTSATHNEVEQAESCSEKQKESTKLLKESKKIGDDEPYKTQDRKVDEPLNDGVNIIPSKNLQESASKIEAGAETESTIKQTKCHLQESKEKETSTGELNDCNIQKQPQDAIKSSQKSPVDVAVNKMTALESLKKELRESKQKSLERSAASLSTVDKIKIVSATNATPMNRKRRLDDLPCQQNFSMRLQNSESEIDINSENADDVGNDKDDLEVDEQDVGGKRLKMRQKQSNTELRKKIEAQKAAVNDETTSSSGGEEESRQKRKIMSPKKQMSENKTEGCVNKPNGQSKEGDERIVEIKEDSGGLTRQQPSTSSLPQAPVLKHKPTLAEIIDKKLKKTPEKADKEVASSSVEESSKKSKTSPPKKCPVTKPLKKNLLTQIRLEESEEEAIPRKRTNSEDLATTVHNDSKESATNNIEKPRVAFDKISVTPERQRKRRSSEETVQNNNAELAEVKIEVECAKLKEEDEGKSIDVVAHIDDVDCIKSINEDPTSDEAVLNVGRRSGRRGLTAVHAEIPKAKRTRGCSKNPPNPETSKNGKTGNIKDCGKTDIAKEIILKIEDGDKSDTNNAFSSNIASEESKNPNEEDQHQTPRKTQTKLQTEAKSTLKGTRKQRDVDTTNIIEATDAETPVRQSRRIAQQKIREEAERRKLEEIALRSMKQELKKKKKAEKQTDPTVLPPSESSSESEESDVETKKKAQKKKKPGKNGSWSSGSEEQEEPDEEEEEDHHRYETDPGSPLFKSDHEFSPESDIEDETQAVPMKRARTARKEDAPDDEPEEEEACQKCNKSDHPEWILLCDTCDKGYHCSCLSPVLFYIPEGDWYCPPCQQEQLIKALEGRLKEFDDLVECKKKEEEEEKRLAEEEKSRREEEDKKQKNNKKNKKSNQRHKDNSSDENHDRSSANSEDSSKHSEDSDSSKPKARDIECSRSKKLSGNDKRNHFDRKQKSSRRTRIRMQKRDSDESDSRKTYQSGSSSNTNSTSSSTYSDSDNEPIYKLRKRRQINVSYRLNEYDDLINSALKKEMDEAAGAGNLGRGKDISTIIEADKEEKARQKQLEEDGDPKDENPSKIEPTSPAKETENDGDLDLKPEEGDSEDDHIKGSPRQKHSLKKKSRKLTTLDISSEDDDGSDEDFKGSSIDDDEEEDTSISASSNSDSSLEVYKRRGKSKKKQRKAARRAFRERRKDRRFVVDESDDDEVQRPKSKKKRKEESDYSESEIEDDDVSELSENVDSADLCDDTSTDESDGAWRPNKRKKSKKSNTTVVAKEPATKKPQIKKTKKIEYSDDDVSESEEEEDNDDDEPLGIGGGKQPRSQPLKTTPKAPKTKSKNKSGSSSKSKKKKSSDEEQSFSDSGDSTRRTRGRRYAYIEDFEDDSSDGGIKPGVQRPDTPPEEREKFIKRQEEIKRMLAEKNAEGAKLAATPRLTPIKSDAEKDKRSPSKPGGDSLSTVPLSVIRQAKVLDIDYLQRRGENLDELSNDVGDVDDDFDDADLPDDLPEDMDEDAIARMVEEEEEFGSVTSRELPAPDEVLRTPLPCSVKPKPKDSEKIVTPPVQVVPLPTPTLQTSAPVSTSGLQEPVRKRLPMPTMHPPLLRHQIFAHESLNSAGQHIMQRQPPPPSSHLLQNALSAPMAQSLHRAYPSPHHSLINRMPQNAPVPPSIPPILGPCRPPVSVVKTTPPPTLESPDKAPVVRADGEFKPRGRRKKITPLRDTLQKQQTAAAVAAAASASVAGKTQDPIASSASSVIKPTGKSQMQQSVITSLQQTSQCIPGRPPGNIQSATVYPGPEGFYGHAGVRLPPPQNTQRHRGPPQMPTSLMASHPTVQPSYGPPPPLKGPITMPLPGASGNTRTSVNHLPPYVGAATTARHSGSHMNLYGPPMYGNPNFGPRGNLRPPPIHPSEYSTGSRAYPPYAFYPPPPPLTTPPPQAPRAPSALQHPAKSVIVSNTPSALSTPSSISICPSAPVISDSPEATSKSIKVKPEFTVSSSPSTKPQPSLVTKTTPETRKKLTTLETFTASGTTTKSPLPVVSEIPRPETSSPGLQANNPDDLSASAAGSENTPADSEQQSASEFSGLVSYFSSQHDDYNT